MQQPAGVDLDLVRSPKLKPNASHRWYRYYAGFAPEFVQDVFAQLPTPQRVLDPWMGSGTTLAIAASHGHAASGIDLNPAMAVIAKGRLIADDTIASVDALCADIIRHTDAPIEMDEDPLTQWFTAESSRILRGLSVRIDELLVDGNVTGAAKSTSMSSLAAFFYVALFEVTTAELKSYQSRNPTWMKRGKSAQGTITLDREEVMAAFASAVRRLKTHATTSGRITANDLDAATIVTGDSRAQPFQDRSHTLVVSSPPYLTRLDYVVGHLPELALLGITGESVKGLRDAMIGTPTMGREVTHRALGTVTEDLLTTVKKHPSRASASYYEPNFRRYFEGMYDSLLEIERVCKPNSPVVLVVQDSRYKDVHVDLASAITNMAEERNWTHAARRDFTNVRSMAQLNKRAHSVARTTRPVESVLALNTPSAS